MLGPDALDPADAPHWKEIQYSGGKGWVNLNGPKVKKFSSADFPHWDDWWMLVDGTTSADSRCRELAVLQLLDVNQDVKVSPQEAQAGLNDPDIQRRLSRKICKFRTEWDPTTIDGQFGWLKTDPTTKMTTADFARFKAHVSALCFWTQAQLGIGNSPWHFHPTTFVPHMRKCGWLSLDEFAQFLPRWPTGHKTPASSAISWSTARSRFQRYAFHLNRVFRKYNVLDAKRQTQFLGQVYIEADLLNTTREYGKGRPKPDGTWAAPMMQYYTVFYGRGLMQLTWPFNYDAYGKFRKFPHIAPGTAYGDPYGRITQTSTHYWSGGPPSPQRVWYPRYDPEHVADDAFAACDSGGFYWVSKNTGGGHLSINRVADRPFAPASVGTISVLVNGGGYGFAERQRFPAFINRYRSDDTSTTGTATVNATHGATNYSVPVDFTAQRP